MIIVSAMIPGTDMLRLGPIIELPLVISGMGVGSDGV